MRSGFWFALSAIAAVLAIAILLASIFGPGKLHRLIVSKFLYHRIQIKSDLYLIYFLGGIDDVIVVDR